VAFRDAECAFCASGVSGGTAHGMILAICLDKLTRKPIDDFKDYLKCQEGALDCPILAKSSFGFQMAGQRRTVRRRIAPSRLGVAKEVNQIAVA
jgi:hypothetical protein